MAFCIDKLSSELCLVHATYQSLEEFPPLLSEHSDDVYDAIHKLNKIFKKEFRSIFEKTWNDEVMHSFELFMKSIAMRFVEMSTNPSYFHFVLLCSFSQAAVFEIFSDTQCFTYAKIMSLCLKAAYERCYKGLFEESAAESENLGSYCKRINASLGSEENKIESYSRQQINSLLQSLQDVDYKNFALTDYEEKMLEDALELVMPEGKKTASALSGKQLSESPDSLSDETSMTSDEDKEHSSKENKVCEFCDRRCFKFLSLYQKRNC